MVIQKTRNNHYVPQWYQRGFLVSSTDKLHYLDLKPEILKLPDGSLKPKNSRFHWGPKSCFCEYDLYTTRFGFIINDDIEKYLFGDIDSKGSVAVSAFIAGDQTGMHLAYLDFFEYMDAQKLRTPKGLDWIKKHYPELSQVELMLEMQNLRTMHCTMWTEGVREIVSAENSDIKFIISDHPVTIHNAGLTPNNPQFEYPINIDLALIGSQTIFVLDSNNCLILTHLEYAQDHENADPLSRRTNARYRGNTFVRTDQLIRKRKLARKDVVAINHVLKNQAARYIAAANPDWLYPEKYFKEDWSYISNVLLPPKNELWGFGGETYIGFKDGSSKYQDAFGRKTQAYKFLERKKVATDLGRNDGCGCGSGHKYKNCCQEISIHQRPSWKVLSIRERNLMLSHAIEDIVGIKAGKSWDDVRRELSAEEVRKIYEFIAVLWPEDTDLTDLLPRAKPNVLRAVYLGAPDPRTIIVTVITWLNYFDEVVLALPFINPALIKPEMNPIDSPAQHKVQTLRNILLLFMLQPFIDLGVVHLVPDPGDFNGEFGTVVRDMAEKRVKDWHPTDGDMSLLRRLYEDEVKRNISRLPMKSLKAYIKRNMSDIQEDMLERVAQMFKDQLEADPFYSLQPIAKEGEVHILKGFNMETAMFLAMLTGSIIYTDIESHWKHLHAFAQIGEENTNDKLTPILNEWKRADLPLDLHIDSVLKTRLNGKNSDFRGLLRRFEKAIRRRETAEGMQQELHRVILKQKIDETIVTGGMDISAPLGGFDRKEVRRLILTFSKPDLVQKVPLVIYVRHMQHNETRENSL